MIKKVITKFFTGHERSVKAKKNIIASVFIKGVSVIVGFLMVRVVLNYLDQTNYGIWLTLSSFLTWFSFFEIGLGNGLRNKLAEALAAKDYNLGKIYVSTTYAILTIVISIVAIVFFISNFFIDWSVILNTQKELSPILSTLALILFGFFFLQFIIQLIGIVLYADQRPAIANAFGPIGNLLSLIAIYILTKTTQGSLIYLGWVLSIFPILVLIIASIYFYSGRYNNIAPSFKYIKFEYAKNLLNLGIKFFFIQIIGLILYQSSNIIIAQKFGPAEVTVYNIAYKYFSITNMMFVIITTPFWSSFTEAWVKKDIEWIKTKIKQLLQIWIGLIFFTFLLFILSQIIYKLWLGIDLKIPWILSVYLALYFLVSSLSIIYVSFLNGIGVVRFQIYISIGELIVFLSIIIALNYLRHFGVESLALALVLSMIFGTIPMIIQYYKIINFKATGIWSK